MTPHATRRCAAGAAAIALLLGCAAVARAQSSEPAGADPHPGQAGSGLNGQVTGAGSGSNYGAAGQNRMDTSEGSTGTGAGKKLPKGEAAGAGVQSPPAQGFTNGQGISNSTDAAK